MKSDNQLPPPLIGKNIASLPTKPSHLYHKLYPWIGILLPPAIYFYLIFSYSLNIPFADDFAHLDEVISIIQTTSFSEQFSILFAPHNEHRVAFNRLAFTLSHILFGRVDIIALTVLGNLALLALLFLLFKIFKTNQTSLLYFVPVSLLLFQLQIWENMIWAQSALQSQFILLFTGLTFYFLNIKSNQYFIIAFFFSVVSVFTHGGGLVTIFLGGIALLIQQRYRQSLIWASGTALIFVLYFSNLHSINNAISGPSSLSEFKDIATYFFSYLGSALSFDDIGIATGFGIILSLYMCYLIKEKYFSKNLTIFMFMFYIFFNAALVAVSRTDLGIENVFTPRYKVVSITLIILVYISLAERFALVENKFQKFVVCGIIFATFYYSFSFKPGKNSLITRSNSLSWLTNQWVNTNHGFFYLPGAPGAVDITPNSILLRALKGNYYSLPHEILNIPEKAYSPPASLPATCKPDIKNSHNSEFSVVPIGPESKPYLIRIEGMIHGSLSEKTNNNSDIHLFLKSTDRIYTFKTHPQHALKGSVFFEDSSSNSGFIALLPFTNIESGLYRIGLCYKNSMIQSDRFLSKKEDELFMAN